MRTQFKEKIIHMLHLFDLTDDERRRMLHGFRPKQKPVTNHSQRTVVGKRSVKRSVTKNSTCNGSNNSLDQETGTCTANTKKCSNENLRLEIQPSVIEISDSDEEQMNRRRNNEFINDTNRTQIKAFSLEEDTKLILFFKSRELYLNHIHDKFVYEVFQTKTSATRSCDELQDRFVNHILPNLFTYKCLTYDEMIKYYDCAGMEVPEQLQSRISEVLGEHARIKQAVRTHNRSTGTDNVATQLTELAHENRQFKIYNGGKYVGIMINNVQHIFVCDMDQDYSEDRKEIHDHFIIADENIHFVDATLYTMLNSASKLEDKCLVASLSESLLIEMITLSHYSPLRMISNLLRFRSL